MKKTRSLLTAIILLVCAVLPISAVQYDETAKLSYENTDRMLPILLDGVGLFDSDEYSTLTEILESISVERECEVAAAIVNSLEGLDIQAYADDLYDYSNYGYGPGDDGILLVIAMDEREWHITTYGFGASAMTDYAIGIASDEVVPYMSSGDYYSAIVMYAQLCELAITEARNGTPLGYDHGGYDDGYYYDDYEAPSTGSTLIVSLVIGFVIALIVTGTMRSPLKTVIPKNSASDYTVRDSMHVTSNRDVFLYRNVTKRAKPQNNSGGSRSGGGTTMHRSSSGRSHGGGGGRF